MARFERAGFLLLFFLLLGSPASAAHPDECVWWTQVGLATSITSGLIYAGVSWTAGFFPHDSYIGKVMNKDVKILESRLYDGSLGLAATHIAEGPENQVRTFVPLDMSASGTVDSSPAQTSVQSQPEDLTKPNHVETDHTPIMASLCKTFSKSVSSILQKHQEELKVILEDLKTTVVLLLIFWVIALEIEKERSRNGQVAAQTMTEMNVGERQHRFRVLMHQYMYEQQLRDQLHKAHLRIRELELTVQPDVHFLTVTEYAAQRNRGRH